MEIFGNVENNKKYLLEQLLYLENKEMGGVLSFEEKEKKIEVLAEIEKLSYGGNILEAEISDSMVKRGR